ncbi:hypothetical protein Slu03_17190 [Sediminihabitans luteus]|nr:hypothetical protein Slu03_17190 [Sediminihabitans luteus]
MLAVVGGWATTLGRLVVPVACAGCGVADVVLCVPCAALLGRPPERCEQDAPRLDRCDGRPPLPVWRAARYEGAVREVVVAWKDRHRADLDRVLAAAVARASSCALDAGHAGGPALVVVPVPSTAAAVRQRGRSPVDVLARAVARSLARTAASTLARTLACTVPCTVAPTMARTAAPRALRALRRVRARDQVGLGARARAHNVADGVAVRRGARTRLRGSRVLLVDDVLTTGATLAACESALRRAGAEVVGAVVLAATPPPGSHRDESAGQRPLLGGLDGVSPVAAPRRPTPTATGG